MKCTNCEKEITDDLILQAKQNDQQAISSLYELTYNSVFHTIRMMIKDEDTVYDLLQDTYLKAFGHLDQLTSPRAFKGWVRTIARNLAVDHLRKKKPMLFSSLVTEEDETLDLPDEHMESMPDAVVDYKETKRLIDEIMNSLPEDQRAVISLHYYDEIPVKDIAAMLGVSENTVKSRLVYGRKKIELGVKDLEKKGTKLYSLAPVPFLMFLLRTMDAQAAEIPDTNILQNVILAEGSAPTQALGEAAVKAGIKGGASIAKKAITTKIIAAVVAVAVVGSGIAGGMYLVNNHGDSEEPQTAQYEEEASVSGSDAPADAALEDFLGYYGDVNGVLFELSELEGKLGCSLYYQGGSEGGLYGSYEISGNTLTAVVEYNNKTHKFILQSDGSIEADIGAEEALPAGIYPRIPDDAELPPWTTAG